MGTSPPIALLENNYLHAYFVHIGDKSHQKLLSLDKQYIHIFYTSAIKYRRFMTNRQDANLRYWFVMRARLIEHPYFPTLCKFDFFFSLVNHMQTLLTTNQNNDFIVVKCSQVFIELTRSSQYYKHTVFHSFSWKHHHLSCNMRSAQSECFPSFIFTRLPIASYFNLDWNPHLCNKMYSWICQFLSHPQWTLSRYRIPHTIKSHPPDSSASHSLKSHCVVLHQSNHLSLVHLCICRPVIKWVSQHYIQFRIVLCQRRFLVMKH